MSEELRSCPFCGHPVKFHERNNPPAQIGCNNSNCFMSWIALDLDKLDTWNTRAPDPKIMRLAEAVRVYEMHCLTISIPRKEMFDALADLPPEYKPEEGSCA